MDRVGVIGYGHMGSMLVKGFLASGVLAPGEVVVASRSRGNLDACAAAWPGIAIAATNADLARRCRTIVIAVRPQETMGVLREIVPVMDGSEHLVSLAAGIGLHDLEEMYAGPVSRVVPTATSAVGEGTTLVCHGQWVGTDEALMVENLFSAVGSVMPVGEEDLAAATLLSSCGPALLAAIIGELAGAAARASSLPPDRALVLATDLLTATAAYLRETGRTPEDLIGEVATRGGVTEVGVQGFRDRLPGVFDGVFAAMLERYGGLRK
ncbi:pyrroline-5-carboxylate reductase [Methanoculleus sp. Wushi-C6]|uniref:Pyrroline-5-carboxylate reductase n=1 Tax=Methanoculleus caldifontis TaxID=2651577 RepID=A0ABU3X454_9EURY|nr:pyrroline-5-carboxylate reductase dimerization domain-containing protein [Methanoculleus sp. Wushi-C6]MDV2482387.1 pyrroline-5-carboxylate reductase [Methanoculleus sp. Wushi-C6]